MRENYPARIRFLALCCGLLSCIGPNVVGQDAKPKLGGQPPKPNLTGTWLLDETPQGSVKSRHPVMGIGQTTLVILHRQPEVKMTKTIMTNEGERTREFIFYADGRGETNQGPALSLSLDDVSGKIKSTTEWKKDKLVMTSKTRRAMQGAFYHVTVFDEWELSDDGQTLTRTTRVNSETADLGARGGPRARFPVFIIPGGGKIKNVYRRLSD